MTNPLEQPVSTSLLSIAAASTGPFLFSDTQDAIARGFEKFQDKAAFEQVTCGSSIGLTHLAVVDVRLDSKETQLKVRGATFRDEFKFAKFKLE